VAGNESKSFATPTDHLKAYVLLHPNAKLSDAEKKLLCAWTDQERARVIGNQTLSNETRQGFVGIFGARRSRP